MSNSDLPEKAWEKLSQVAVHGAVYDSRERLPHPKCLIGTRTNLLKHIYGFLDNPEKSQLVWLHGTAGVGKSAVAFTVAERMRGLKASEETTVEKRLAGTFFFSRTNCRTTVYFFATLAYQLARNFPSVRSDVCKAIIENPAVLESNSSVRDQMEALFFRPLRKLRQRQQNCPPLSFVIDALDECTSESELVELISLLGQALREPDLPGLHILLTSRSEENVRIAMKDEEVHPLVCEIPVKNSGDGVPDINSLDGADVENDIDVFFNHSFTNLRDRHRDFPQPTPDQLVKLATRAGRRFIVASTMMKFIDDGHNDPRGRLQIMLDLTSHLLPGTDIYRLYDCILSTCADPNQAYLHLSVVATLADPLPVSQISKLLGPGEGNDFEKTLVQLRSIMDIPTDSSFPVNFYHSSVRDYVSNPSNCSIPNLQYIAPHSLLAYSSLRLMTDEIPASTALLDWLVKLKRHGEVIPSVDPRKLRESLAFVVQPLEPLQVLSGLLWVRGDRSPVLRCWLETPDGRAWLETENGRGWQENKAGADYDENGAHWLLTEGGHGWLESENGKIWFQRHRHSWLRSDGGKDWLQTQAGKIWLQTEDATEWIETGACDEMPWLDTEAGRNWLQTQAGQSWLQTTDTTDWLPYGGWLATQAGRDWLQTQSGQRWLHTEDAKRYWLLTTREGGDWLQTQSGGDWLQTQSGGDWMLIEYGEGEWMPIEVEDGEEGMWLQTPGGRAWLRTQSIQDWLQTSRGRCWLWGQHELDWLLPEGGTDWLETEGGSEWLENRVGKDWLWTKGGQDWLWTGGGTAWLQSRGGKAWLNTEDEESWLQPWAAQRRLNPQDGQGWLRTMAGRDWLQTKAAQDWLRTMTGRDWLQTKATQDWLQTQSGRDWLQTQRGRDWLRTQGGEDWLQTESGRDWLQTPHGEAWPFMGVWVTLVEFWSVLEAVSQYPIVPDPPCLPAFQVIQHLKSLPDFLMFPVFLASRHHNNPTFASPQDHLPDVEIIRAMKAVVNVANKGRERSQSASDALKYACHNWAIHLARAPRPWDAMLGHTFDSFWNDKLLYWLEMQWCSKGLRACLTVLYEGEKFARVIELIDTDATQTEGDELPPNFFDGVRDGVHSSTTYSNHQRSSTRRRLLAHSSRNALLGRLSTLFRRSPSNINQATELPQRPRWSIFSDRGPRVVEVAAVRDRQALYVAPPRVKKTQGQSQGQAQPSSSQSQPAAAMTFTALPVPVPVPVPVPDTNTAGQGAATMRMNLRQLLARLVLFLCCTSPSHTDGH